MGANRANSVAKKIRNTLKEYFVSPIGQAQAPWQHDYTFRGAIINPPH